MIVLRASQCVSSIFVRIAVFRLLLFLLDTQLEWGYNGFMVVLSCYIKAHLRRSISYYQFSGRNLGGYAVTNLSLLMLQLHWVTSYAAGKIMGGYRMSPLLPIYADWNEFLAIDFIRYEASFAFSNHAKWESSALVIYEILGKSSKIHGKLYLYCIFFLLSKKRSWPSG